MIDKKNTDINNMRFMDTDNDYQFVKTRKKCITMENIIKR